MQNVVVNMCEKFRYDWLRNDRALGNGKYARTTTTTLVAIGDPFPGLTNSRVHFTKRLSFDMWQYRQVIEFKTTPEKLVMNA